MKSPRVEVRLGDGIGDSTLRDYERPAEADKPNPSPPYPAYAQQRGMQGTVHLRLHVGTNGEVVLAEIIQSSGFPLLDSTAQRWVTKIWHFAPALHNAKPVPDTKDQNIKFYLE